MPTQPEIQNVLSNYIKSTKILLVLDSEDRPLDQFIEFRNKVFMLVEKDNFLAAVSNGLKPDQDIQDIEVIEAILLEMKSFSNAVEVAQQTAKDEAEKKGWFSNY